MDLRQTEVPVRSRSDARDRFFTVLSIVLITGGSAIYARVRTGLDGPFSNEVNLIDRISSGDLVGTLRTIMAGVGVNDSGCSTYTPLTWAADDGDLAGVERLIAAGADVNGLTEQGLSALALAAGHGRADIVRKLLESGADVNQRLRADSTALHLGAVGGDIETMRLLIDGGADVTAMDECGRTPLLLVLDRDDGSPERAQLLIEAGSDMDVSSWDGISPRSLAASSPHPETRELARACGLKK